MITAQITKSRNRCHPKNVKKETKEYYKNYKEKLQEQAQGKYTELSNEDKNIKKRKSKGVSQ